jgi:hypothetical protein
MIGGQQEVMMIDTSFRSTNLSISLQKSWAFRPAHCYGQARLAKGLLITPALALKDRGRPRLRLLRHFTLKTAR